MRASYHPGVAYKVRLALRLLVLAPAAALIWRRSLSTEVDPAIPRERPVSEALSEPPNGEPLQPRPEDGGRTEVEAQPASERPGVADADDDEAFLRGRVVDSK